MDWERLARSGRVHYRVISSTSATAWVDPLVSTLDSEAAQAPSVQIGAASGPRRAAIQGPPTAAREDAGPVWSVSLPQNPPLFYAVEMATDPSLFARANSANRTADNYFASWTAEMLIADPEYRLPADVWDRLKYARRLFYRMITSESATSWVNPTATVSETDAANAPFIELLDGINPREPVARRFAEPEEQPHAAALPSISGPDEYDRASVIGPTFLVRPGQDRYFAVEVAASPAMLAAGADRPADTSVWFASWWKGLLPAGLDATGAVAFTLPIGAWRALRENDALYYRVLTSATADGWTTVQISDPGEDGIPPAIALTGAVAPRPTVTVRSDERSWRDEA
jgi:hypothetical protein